VRLLPNKGRSTPERKVASQDTPPNRVNLLLRKATTQLPRWPTFRARKRSPIKRSGKASEARRGANRGGGVERMLPWLETSSAATIAARTAARLETRCWNRDDAGTGTILEEARHGNRMASRGRRRKDTTSIEWHCGARGKAGNVSSLT